jgi:hypothetical protein
VIGSGFGATFTELQSLGSSSNFASPSQLFSGVTTGAVLGGTGGVLSKFLAPTTSQVFNFQKDTIGSADVNTIITHSAYNQESGEWASSGYSNVILNVNNKASTIQVPFTANGQIEPNSFLEVEVDNSLEGLAGKPLASNPLTSNTLEGNTFMPTVSEEGISGLPVPVSKVASITTNHVTGLSGNTAFNLYDLTPTDVYASFTKLNSFKPINEQLGVNAIDFPEIMVGNKDLSISASPPVNNLKVDLIDFGESGYTYASRNQFDFTDLTSKTNQMFLKDSLNVEHPSYVSEGSFNVQQLGVNGKPVNSGVDVLMQSKMTLLESSKIELSNTYSTGNMGGILDKEKGSVFTPRFQKLDDIWGQPGSVEATQSYYSGFAEAKTPAGFLQKTFLYKDFNTVGLEVNQKVLDFSVLEVNKEGFDTGLNDLNPSKSDIGEITFGGITPTRHSLSSADYTSSSGVLDSVTSSSNVIKDNTILTPSSNIIKDNTILSSDQQNYIQQSIRKQTLTEAQLSIPKA